MTNLIAVNRVHLNFCQSTNLGFLSGNFLLKLGITFGFITQSKLLGGRTPQTTERISFSVGCLQIAADISVII
ncbi:MAG: hypothetical protein EWV49_04330 [Microcystis aeruginosa Ma_QC_Ch_20071001_S25]|uniref:Mobile element protein n=1 Tax=Microcystis aeruginosa Ma_QC_Ch_20071001_S25D TaxID=2486250 RepID=A0A552FTQ2_MICAE|nr:hypothetical protein [Microcystis sp. M113S1]TRU50114.1 MAG: hypothetical protein EWV57_11120 [Microcystis aeruginosa Ma_QC_Ch_20071001_S25D]TRU53144.1 MAG: hypothetical protein EWV49_04330 [Microcystis aeruginosa Ma_QC_Ch_20071001_S25]TRU65149.1 MAG: hypothetical protein EWV90_05300 [Microcystis aeruginosa Ma_QC_Ch_20071001_M135]